MLVPIEHLGPDGLSGAFAAAVAARGWSAARIALFDAAFARYWQRSASLARRVPGWPAPRLRHVAVLADPLAVHPYAALLNTSAWTLYADDLDPATSHPELAAYLLAHGDRLMTLGEVTMAALHHAPWWLERDDAECAAFAAAAARSSRPDAAAYRALAAALPWLRRLGHAALRPLVGPHRVIPGSGVQVPSAIDGEPPALVRAWSAAARGAVDAYTARWRAPDPGAATALLDWLADDAPPLLLTAQRRILWTPDAPARLDALRDACAGRSGVALRDIAADLAIVAARTRRILATLAAPEALPAASDAEQRGYVYMHRERGVLAYDLDEPGIDRRHGPALPFARAMLGARAVHEWAHRAVDAGYVPWALPAPEREARLAAIAAQLDAAVAAAPPGLRAATADDLAALTAEDGTPGRALARRLVERMPDFQCNLLAQRFCDERERETYVRHNIRSLRGEIPPPRRWRLLVRYLYELQYLRFSAVSDPRRFLLASTWADADLIDCGLVTRAVFDALADAVAALCDGYAVDERRVR
ncbi:hypothetical protein KF840_04940 [bacterium]|nr:hypothetical protein [bacterium]